MEWMIITVCISSAIALVWGKRLMDYHAEISPGEGLDKGAGADKALSNSDVNS